MDDPSSALHAPFLSNLSAPGAVFDKTVGYKRMAPIILHVIVIGILNQVVYRRVAEYLTALENHHYQAQVENALILKRYLIQPRISCFVLINESHNQQNLT